MKLKKIASLMLAGIMAVSMLAGCKSGDSNKNDAGSSSSEVISTGAAAVLNNVQDKIEFKDATNNYLASAVKKATFAEVDGATFASNVTALSSGKAVYDELINKILPKDYNMGSSFTSYTPVAGKSSMKTVVYLVDDVVSEETALSVLASQLKNDRNFADVVTVGSANKVATYTGEVSVSKVTKTNEAGDKTASAYYILITVTQSVSK